MEQRTLFLRPFRFLHNFSSLPVPTEAVIIKKGYLPAKREGEDHLFYGMLARISGSSGSQILLANALELPTEAHDIPFPMSPLELAIRYAYLSDIEGAEALGGKKAESLVHFLRTFENKAYLRQNYLWVNIGHGCCSYRVEYQPSSPRPTSSL